jgi:hypothetical protein
MTHLQEVRKRIADFEKKLSGLRSNEEYMKGIVGLEIADPVMRKWAEEQIPAVQREFESVLIQLRDAEAEEHRLTWPRLQSRTSRR